MFLAAGTILYLFAPDRGDLEHGLLRPDDRRMVALGREIYATQCASCHGGSGEGQQGWELATAENPLAPPHDGTGHTWEHPDAALIELTRTGLSTIACRTLDSEAMPKFDEILGDEEIVAVLSYIKSTWPEHIRRQNAAINAIYASQPN